MSTSSAFASVFTIQFSNSLSNSSAVLLVILAGRAPPRPRAAGPRGIRWRTGPGPVGAWSARIRSARGGLAIRSINLDPPPPAPLELRGPVGGVSIEIFICSPFAVTPFNCSFALVASAGVLKKTEATPVERPLRSYCSNVASYGRQRGLGRQAEYL